MNECCGSSTRGIPERSKAGVRELLAFVPKCPACLAAYVALWTVLGISISTAATVRWAMILLCAASLLFLTVKRLSRSMKCPRSLNQAYESWG
ncbi:hypothetical protein KOR42_54720 [Thalassoglobus neptunius]|uniref:Uncharacterized protein n=1 Tax=Thalassoglobus neptunius TaxID=1938619 RepID=A0A5C5UXZ6_9PLAN|nr:hypothetical protein KOR42_54720 [Thalassoglobus neptunius]